MEIRPTIEDDWHLLKEIRLAALKDSPRAFAASYARASTYDEVEWRKRAGADSRPNYWLALDENIAVGMIGCAIDPDVECHLIAMWVRPDFRQFGIAGRLVDAVKGFALERGCQRVVLSVAPENIPAVRLYERHGFIFINEWEPLEDDPDIRVQKMTFLSA